MNQSNSLKQIIICGSILLICGFGAFFVNKYLDSDEEGIDTEIELKDKYEYNEFTLVNVNDEMLVQRYFVDFKDKMLNDTEKAYELLGSDTKDVYKTYNDFKDYVNSKLEELSVSYVVKYDIQKDNNNINYIIIDQFDNMYSFKSKAVLVYSVNLELYDENASIFE